LSICDITNKAPKVTAILGMLAIVASWGLGERSHRKINVHPSPGVHRTARRIPPIGQPKKKSWPAKISRGSRGRITARHGMSAADALSGIMDSLGQSTISHEVLDRIGTLSDQQCVQGLNSGLAEMLLSYFQSKPSASAPTSEAPPPRRVLESLACAFSAFLPLGDLFLFPRKPHARQTFLLRASVFGMCRLGQEYRLWLHFPRHPRVPRPTQTSHVYAATKAGGRKGKKGRTCCRNASLPPL
jgi:hypothetical protein